MTILKLALQSFKRNDSFTAPNTLVNMFVEQEPSGANPGSVSLIQRPGLTPYANLPGPARGMFYSDTPATSRIYTVAGDKLYTLYGGFPAEVGTIANDGQPVKFASTFDNIVLVSAGLVYSISNNNVIFSIPVPDNKLINDVASINNFIVLSCADGYFYYMFPGEDTIDALSFYNAESLPDGIVGIKELNGDLYIFGSNSLEVWQFSSAADNDDPFRRAAGRNQTRGLKGRDTVQVVDSKIFFVGNNGQVLATVGLPQRVSTDAIEERIRGATGPMSSITATFGSHELYVLKIPGQGSFAYDVMGNYWTEFRSTDAANWRPQYAVAKADQIFFSDSQTGKIWIVDFNNATDDGVAIQRAVNANVVLLAKPSRNPTFTLRLGCNAPTSVQFRYRDGGGEWQSTQFMNFPAGSSELTVWRLGHARAPYREYELSTSSLSKSTFQSARVNDGQLNVSPKE